MRQQEAAEEARRQEEARAQEEIEEEARRQQAIEDAGGEDNSEDEEEEEEDSRQPPVRELSDSEAEQDLAVKYWDFDVSVSEASSGSHNWKKTMKSSTGRWIWRLVTRSTMVLWRSTVVRRL
jgi:hypothetical protein